MRLIRSLPVRRILTGESKKGSLNYLSAVVSKIPREHMLLDIQACFQIAHGNHMRREAMLWQKVVDHYGLLRLLSSETAPEHKGPDS
jgi:hypothetical protein